MGHRERRVRQEARRRRLSRRDEGGGGDRRGRHLQRDGTLDLVVNLITPAGGDDPSTARVAEYRPGPLKRSNLGSATSRHSDIGDHGEAQQLRIANYGGDAYPDLAILNNAGDGQLDRDVRLTKPGRGPGNHDYELQLKYGQFGTTPEPPAMPSDGWKHFYKPCS
ncbi:hypothetical protein [Streptomyces sioyaensis]|uniref:hypothetical protein n=1 Tax=Streptomyces sioyaensis TaxID=67364 RepID=UPI0037A0BFC6